MIKLASLNWEPYIGETVDRNGYVAEIAREAFKAAGYVNDIRIDFLPWARAVAQSRRGAYDGLFPEYYDEERKQDFVFSDPFHGGPLVLMKLKSREIEYDGDLKALKPFKIGIIRGYVNTKAFDDADYLQKEECTNDLQNLKKLLGKRVDLIVIDRLVATYLIARNLPPHQGKIEPLQPPLEIKPLYIAFSRKAPDYRTKLEDFNAGLKAMRKNGKLRAILTEFGFSDTVSVDGD